MPKFSELRNNFTAGELSENVNARDDFGRYYNGCRIIENFDPRPQGLASKRKGSSFLAETKDSSKLSALYEFTYSSTQTYAIEFGDLYARFYTNEARVLEDAKTISGATQANPVVITATAHGYSNGNVVVIDDVVGMTELNGKEYTVANVTANSFELSGIDGTSFTAYSSGGKAYKIHEITTPYTQEEIFDLAFTQDGDVMYFAHPDHPVQKLTRLSVNEFTLSEVEFLKGPYTDKNKISTDLITHSGGTNEGDSATLTATGGHTPFSSDHVGALWKLESGNDEAHVKITGFTSSTVVSIENKSDVAGSIHNVALSTWSEGEFSDVRGYPRAIAIHEQRLVLAGTESAPQKKFYSKSNADYENFEAGTNADDAFIVKFGSLLGDPIRWILSDDVLFIGTSGGIFRVRSSNNSAALTPTDIDIKKHISQGCDILLAQQVDSSVLYVQAGGQIVRKIGFSLNSDKYRATDITIDADHITGTGIIETNSQQIPSSNLILVRKDGQIAKLVLEQDQEINGWYRYTTNGSYESTAIIRNNENKESIYTIVKRVINGVTKRYVEVIKPNYDNDDINAIYADSSLTYDGTVDATLTISGSTATAGSAVFSSSDVGKWIHELGDNVGRAKITAFTDSQNVTIEVIEDFSAASLSAKSWAIAIKNITGLDHLIGKEVVISSDGATETPATVDSNGEVNIPETSLPGSIIHAGLAYTAKLSPMPIESITLQSIFGSTQGKLKTIDSAIVRFKETRGGKIVVEKKEENQKNIEIPINARSFKDKQNKVVPLFTGDQDLTIASGYSRQSFINIESSEPQPMTIKSITFRGTVND